MRMTQILIKRVFFRQTRANSSKVATRDATAVPGGRLILFAASGLLDMRVEVWWTRSKKWFAGTVVAEDTGDGSSRVAYDNGKSFWHKLDEVKWRRESDGAAVKPSGPARGAAADDGAFSPSSSSSGEDGVMVRSSSRRRKPKQRASSEDEVCPAIRAAAAEVELSFDDSEPSEAEGAFERGGGGGARGLSLNDSDDDDDEEEESGDDSHTSPKRRIVRVGSRASGRKTRSSCRIARGSADRSQATREVVRGLVSRRNTKRAAAAAATAAADDDDDDDDDDGDEYNDDGSDGSSSDSDDSRLLFERPTAARKKAKKRERGAACGRAVKQKRRRTARASEPRRRQRRARGGAAASAAHDDDAPGAPSWAEQTLASVGAGRLATEVVSVVADLRAQGVMSVIDRILDGSGTSSDGGSEEEGYTLAEMMQSVDRDHQVVDVYMEEMIAEGGGGASGTDSGAESVLRSADQRGCSSDEDGSSASEEERAAAAAPTERRPHQLVPLLRQLCAKREVQAALRSNCIADQLPTHLHAFGALSGCGNVGKLLTASRSTMVDNKSVDLFKMALAKQLEIRKMGGQGKRASLGALAVADRRNTDIYGAACRGVLHVRRLRTNEQRLVDRDWNSLDRKLEEDFSRRHCLREGSDSGGGAFSEADEWSAARGQSRGRGGGGGGGARGAEVREVKARTLKGYELIQSGNFKWREMIGVEKPSPKMFQRIVCRVCQKWVKKPTHLATFFDDADDMSDSGGESGESSSDGVAHSGAKPRALRAATYGFARTRLRSQSPSQAQSQSSAQSQALHRSHAPGRICCSDCGRSLAKGTELVRLLRAWGAFPLPAVSEANLITEQQRRDLCAITTAIALHLYDDATEPAYLAENIEEWSRGSASSVDGERRARSGNGERQLELSLSLDGDREGDLDERGEEGALFSPSQSQSQSQPSWGAWSSELEGRRASGGNAGVSENDDPDGDVPLAQRWTAADDVRDSARGGSAAQSSAPPRSNRAAQRRASPGQSQLSWPAAGLLPRRRRVKQHGSGLPSSAVAAARRNASKRAPLPLVHHDDGDENDDVVDLT